MAGLEPSMTMNIMDVTADTLNQMIVVQHYRKRNDAIVQTDHASGSVPEYCPGKPSNIRSYTVDHGGLFTRATAIVQITGST